MPDSKILPANTTMMAIPFRSGNYLVFTLTIDTNWAIWPKLFLYVDNSRFSIRESLKKTQMLKLWLLYALP